MLRASVLLLPLAAASIYPNPRLQTRSLDTYDDETLQVIARELAAEDASLAARAEDIEVDNMLLARHRPRIISKGLTKGFGLAGVTGKKVQTRSLDPYDDESFQFSARGDAAEHAYLAARAEDLEFDNILAARGKFNFIKGLAKKGAAAAKPGGSVSNVLGRVSHAANKGASALDRSNQMMDSANSLREGAHRLTSKRPNRHSGQYPAPTEDGSLPVPPGDFDLASAPQSHGPPRSLASAGPLGGGVPPRNEYERRSLGEDEKDYSIFARDMFDDVDDSLVERDLSFDDEAYLESYLARREPEPGRRGRRRRRRQRPGQGPPRAPPNSQESVQNGPPTPPPPFPVDQPLEGPPEQEPVGRGGGGAPPMEQPPAPAPAVARRDLLEDDEFDLSVRDLIDDLDLESLDVYKRNIWADDSYDDEW